MAEPLFGQGFFHVAPGVIYYTIVFDYRDEEEEYYELLRRGGGAVAEEERRLAREMQGELDKEKMLINGARVAPRVVGARIGVRGEPDRSFATFLIEIPWSPRRGANVYEDYYEPDVAEYDYVVYWLFPEGARVRAYDMPGDVSVDGRILTVSVRANTRVPGYESIIFEMP